MKPAYTPATSVSRAQIVAAFLAIMALGTVTAQATEPLPDWALEGTDYMVASDHPLASAAGASILSAGGNAVDAAIAVSFALGVVRPYSTGLGGGGFALVKIPGEDPVAIDFREMAPAACRPDKYVNSSGNAIADKTIRGLWAVGVPGTLKAIEHMLAKFGTMGLEELLAPAIQLATSGFAIDAHTHQVMTTLSERRESNAQYQAPFAELYETFLIENKPYQVGDTIRRPRLAATLKQIAQTGADALYAKDGFLHVSLVKHMQAHGGPITSNDLQNYSVIEREPLKGRFKNLDTWTMPPPSSGGAVITQVLNAVDRMTLESSDDWPHFFVECMKHSFADRARGLGDLDFDTSGGVRQMLAQMLDTGTALQMVQDFDPSRTYKSDHYGSGTLEDDHGTSHFCVVDSDGRAVSWSETINLEFGSYAMIPGSGIVLNDQLDDFSISSGVANQFGLIQSDANLMGPGKRPLSSMSPTIITRNDALVFLAGGSGGPRIITGTLHALINSLVFGIRADSALRAPRFHHQWQPDKVRVETSLGDHVISGLVKRGHTVYLYPGSAGIVQLIDCRNEKLLGACDPRKGGRPAGR
jgi:gamma-glutamyltranspeptidase/glutathione hydrolase